MAAHFSHFSYIPHRNIILCHGKSFRKSVLNKLIVAASENYENQICSQYLHDFRELEKLSIFDDTINQNS